MPEGPIWVWRTLLNVPARDNRADFVVRLGSGATLENKNETSFGFLLNETVQVMKESYFRMQNSESAYVYKAFVDSWNSSSTAFSGKQQSSSPLPTGKEPNPELLECLMSNASFIAIVDVSFNLPEEHARVFDEHVSEEAEEEVATMVKLNDEAEDAVLINVEEGGHSKGPSPGTLSSGTMAGTVTSARL